MAGAGRTVRMAIEQATETLDSERDPVTTWSPYVTVWAKLTPLSGRELYTARQLFADVTHEIETGYVAGVHPKMRGRVEQRTFDFASVRNVGDRNRDLSILAVERV